MTAQTLKIETVDGHRTTAASWSEIRTSTLAAHEIPSLFENIAEISDTDSDDHEDFETSEGVPVSAYGSPLSLWEMKTGRYSDAGNAKRGLWSRIKWGVITHAAEEIGFDVDRPEGVYIHPTLDFMSSRIDMKGSDDNWQTFVPIVSFNVAGTMVDTWRNATGDWTPPEYVHMQAQHHMACTGTDICLVVALFGGVKARHFTIERDQEMIDVIEETATAFWDAVENDRQPAAASGDRDLQVLQRLCSKIDPKTEIVDRRNDEAFIAKVQQMSALAAEKGKIEKEIKAIKAELSAEMDGVGSAIISDVEQFSWIHTAEREVAARTQSASAYLRTKKISTKTAGTPLAELVG